MKMFTKSSLIKELNNIRKMGWIENSRYGNTGSVGNTLEDLLGIQENNLPIPNASEWELKCQRKDTKSLITLFHMEPSPRSFKFVPRIFLPLYGWNHKEAGLKYSPEEKSFRQTIHGNSTSDRGFKVLIDRDNKNIKISFDYKSVSPKHSEWLNQVKNRIGLNELNPQPYWGFNDLYHKAGTKLLNSFYVKAQVKKENKKTYFRYTDILMLENFSWNNFLKLIENGSILIDFDARTGHNHGTKFRLKQNNLEFLYKNNTIL